MIIDHHRKKRESSLELTAEPHSSDPDLVLQTQHRIAINKIENMIAALDELSWLIVHLKLIEWLSYDEIGTIVALNPAAIRKRYSRAISDIKKNPDIAGYLGDE
jgi:RNA polymerase sigma factor (sigma-70 family)